MVGERKSVNNLRDSPALIPTLLHQTRLPFYKFHSPYIRPAHVLEQRMVIEQKARQIRLGTFLRESEVRELQFEVRGMDLGGIA